MLINLLTRIENSKIIFRMVIDFLALCKKRVDRNSASVILRSLAGSGSLVNTEMTSLDLERVALANYVIKALINFSSKRLINGYKASAATG